MTVRPRQRSRTVRGRGPDSIIKNTASSFAAQMMTASLTAVLTVFLVRALGAKQFGLFAVTMGMGAVAVALADLGISNSTARFVAEHRGRDNELLALIADALKLKLVLTGFVCAVLAALASVIASAYGNPEIVWPLRGMALATLGQSTFLMVLAISTAQGRAVVNVRLVAIESMLELSASVALVLAGGGAAGAAFGRAIGYVVGAVIAAWVALRLSGRGPVGFWRLPKRETIRRVGGYAGPVFAIDASYMLSASLSVLLLGAFVGSAASGIFQAPTKLIVLVQYVGLSVANGVAPRLARGAGQEPDVRAMQGALKGLIAFYCLTLAPVVVWAGPITHVLLGPGYSQSADVLAALAPYILFSGLAPLVTNGVNYLGEAGRRVPIAFATLALTAVGGVILIPSHGAVGAAIACDIAFGFYTLAHIWLCRRLLKLRIGALLWSLACGLTAAAAMGIVLASGGTTHLEPLDWVKGGVGGVVVFVMMLIFTREIRKVHLTRAIAVVRAHLPRLRVTMKRRHPTTPRTSPRSTGASSREQAAAIVRVTHSSAHRRAGSLPGPFRADVGVGEVGGRGRPAAAEPSASLEGFPSDPAAAADTRAPPPSVPTPHTSIDKTSRLGGARTGYRARNGEPQLPAPTEPPAAALGNGLSSDAGESVEATKGPTRGRGRTTGGSPAAPAASGASPNLVYQVAWRAYDGTGVFELRPVEPSEGHGTSRAAPRSPESPPVPWSWRMAPARIPQAQRAHAALVERVLAAGWQPAGKGDTWFADRFRSPEVPSSRPPRLMKPNGAAH